RRDQHDKVENAERERGEQIQDIAIRLQPPGDPQQADYLPLRHYHAIALRSPAMFAIGTPLCRERWGEAARWRLIASIGTFTPPNYSSSVCRPYDGCVTKPPPRGAANSLVRAERSIAPRACSAAR